MADSTLYWGSCHVAVKRSRREKEAVAFKQVIVKRTFHMITTHVPPCGGWSRAFEKVQRTTSVLLTTACLNATTSSNDDFVLRRRGSWPQYQVDSASLYLLPWYACIYMHIPSL